MGDILNRFMKSDKGKQVATEATKWFSGPRGRPAHGATGQAGAASRTRCLHAKPGVRRHDRVSG